MATHPLWQPFELVEPDTIAAVFVAGAPHSRGPIEVVEPDPSWPAVYAALAAELRAALGDRVVDLAHVGSTSVPGLPAKPVIDIDLTVADSADEPSYLPELERLGFTLTVREPEWQEHRCLVREGPAVNLHVFGPGAVEPKRHLFFRDHLRASAADRARYIAAKRAAAAAGPAHTMDYNNAKAGAIYDIYERAFAADPAHDHTPHPR